VVLLPPAAPPAEEEHAVRAFSAEAQEGMYAFLTSGSTGRPKVVLAAYDRLYRHQLTQAEALGLGAQDTVLLTAPLAYSYAVRGGLLVGLLAGATVVLPPSPLDPRSLRDCLERHRVTVTFGLGIAYRLLLASGSPLPALRTAVFGGEALPDDLAATWRQRTGVPLMEGFGCTESDTVAWNVDLVPGSLGRPLPGAEVRVCGEDGEPARHGVGELLVRTPDLACGYAGEPEVTEERFADGWYRTGDLAELCEDGHIRLRGRLDDRLNVAGLKVDPREVEAACREAIELRDCAVVGVPRVDGIVEVCAYVVADRPVRRADLVRALADRLSPHKIPTRVVQLDALPRTAAGKLRAGDLRQ
jgi:acyl-coenzyme A synthetase/AMP-(fatty) acid ligase